MSGHILVVSSCTARKLETPGGGTRCAESLYTGQQHVRLMRGIDDYRAAGQPAGELRFRILSAFYGLLSPEERVLSYDHSFSGLPATVISRQGREKNIPRDLRKLLGKPFDLGLLLLGDPYLRACELDANLKLGGPLISFCSPAAARRMPKIAGLHTVTLANAEARRFSCGLIALKGELGGQLLARLAIEPQEVENLTPSNADVLGWLEAGDCRRRASSVAA
ncbi:MAG TPA: hypothetical protein VK691_12190 [Solirubrobacteraceae bacterium]|jgi:hypothetical protein|nr:hypothetical protein [Solirubrobacteraceae bacterium]